ncbi:MAG: hypothetical protein KDC27_12270, partial [Acidobacteria bacterium]|nr:hypothetical protein [Acidobacteriota bacterium]
MSSFFRPLALFAACGLLFGQSPDELFNRGMEQAGQGRFAEARASFAAGRRTAPAQTRFWVEGA